MKHGKRCPHTSTKKFDNDFLVVAKKLAESNRIATDGKGVTVDMDAEQLDAYECSVGQLQERAAVYLPLVADLLDYSPYFCDAGAAILVSFDFDEYQVAAWPAPVGMTTNQVHEMMLEQVGDTPFDWNFDVEQVFYAFRLNTKANPVCVYSMAYTGEKLMYVLHDGQWHKLPGLESIIQLALSCAELGDIKAFTDPDCRYLDHDQIVDASSESPLLMKAISNYEGRSELAIRMANEEAELSKQDIKSAFAEFNFVEA